MLARLYGKIEKPSPELSGEGDPWIVRMGDDETERQGIEIGATKFALPLARSRFRLQGKSSPQPSPRPRPRPHRLPLGSDQSSRIKIALGGDCATPCSQTTLFDDNYVLTPKQNFLIRRPPQTV